MIIIQGYKQLQLQQSQQGMSWLTETLKPSINYSRISHKHPITSRLKTQASSSYYLKDTYDKNQNKRLKTESHIQLSNVSRIDIDIKKKIVSKNKDWRDMSVTSSKQQMSSQQKKQNTDRNQRINMQKTMMFKNLSQLNVDIITQKSRLRIVNSKIKAYALGTYKGVNKNINTHQIGLHFGELNSFMIAESYDGLYAASILKKQYITNLLGQFKKSKIDQKDNSFQLIEKSIYKTYQKSQQNLSKLQFQKNDNSGSSLSSIVIHNDILFTANCGVGQVVCLSVGEQLIELCQKHNTQNKNQINRIINQGGSVYQTTVNLPYQPVMEIQGPLRIYPSGLSLTRTMGKSFNLKAQSPYAQKKIQQKGRKLQSILSIPQIRYISMNNVKWVVMLSEKVSNFITRSRIRQIIKQEMLKRTQTYDESYVSQHCCKRIILEAVDAGAVDSLTVILIIANAEERQAISIDPKSIKIKNNPRKNVIKPRSLKYIGHRHNFVENVEEEEEKQLFYD